MGSLYRSERMVLCQLFLQQESAYSCLSELGEIGLVMFKDLNKDVNSFQRKYVNEVRRCEESERKLRFLESEMKNDQIAILDIGDDPEAATSREISDIEAVLERLESEMKEVNSNYDALKRNLTDLMELKHVLSKTSNFFDEVTHYQRNYDSALLDPLGGGMGHDDLESTSLLRDDSLVINRIAFGFIAGVVLRDRIPSFERMLWRACHGNVLLRHVDIDQPLENSSGDEQYKSVFIVFFQGDQLKTRIKKICDGFHGKVYPCPETQTERREMAMGVVTRIEDLKTVINQTEEHRYRVLVDAASRIRTWSVKVRKMKAIYHTLNMFIGGTAGNKSAAEISGSRGPKSLIGECWCPVRSLDVIQQALRRGTSQNSCEGMCLSWNTAEKFSFWQLGQHQFACDRLKERSGSSVASILNTIETNESPPTYHRTNKFTQVYQTIIDAYGVACYREVNPAPFSIITFPFLFSVMFGDIGHGLLMFLFGLWMVLSERKLHSRKGDSEMWSIVFSGRYIITLMGFFSIYSGFMYNDIFSQSFNIFGSSWHAPEDRYVLKGRSSKDFMLDPARRSDYTGTPYPFGLDPVWTVAENAISFLNSYKMKISVIFGVSQMLFGVVLSYINHRNNNDRLSIVCEFIPQVLFLLSIFGYLIILIFCKWLFYSAETSHCAPSLLIGLINMFLNTYPKANTTDKNYDEVCAVVPFYTGQRAIQTILMIIVIACVPWMLIPKPLILRRRHLERPARKVTERTSLVNSNVYEMETRHTLSVQSGDILLHENQFGLPSTSSSAAAVITVEHHQHVHQETAAADEHEFDFAEVLVHQSIHTIEYCLGCISHTASYLRLWALSLAHAELSEVLWSMVLSSALRLELKGFPFLRFAAIVFCWCGWAVMTVVILLLMEGLSAFLHTLRLHWVEFQSKFYKGEGYAFEPFSFSRCLDPDADDADVRPSRVGY